MDNRRKTAYLLLIFSSFIWGIAGPIIKYTLQYFPPAIFLTYRFGLSTLVALIAFLFWKPTWTHRSLHSIQILSVGLLTSTVSLGLLFLGFDKTTALTGSLISAASPVLTALAGGILLHDHVTKIEKLGIGLAFLGTVFTVVQPLFNGNTLSTGSIEGNLLILLSVIIGVIVAVWTKKLLQQGVDPGELSHISFIVGFISMIPILLWTTPIHTISTSLFTAPLVAHGGVIYMAVLSGTIAYALWNMGQKSIEVSEAGLFHYLLPLWATPLSILWLGESLNPSLAFGMIVIAVGVGIAEYKKRKPSHHRASKRNIQSHGRQRR